MLCLMTKKVEATPMTYMDFILEKTGQYILMESETKGYRIEFENGKVSWVPEEEFEKDFTIIE